MSSTNKPHRSKCFWNCLRKTLPTCRIPWVIHSLGDIALHAIRVRRLSGDGYSSSTRVDRLGTKPARTTATHPQTAVITPTQIDGGTPPLPVPPKWLRSSGGGHERRLH